MPKRAFISFQMEDSYARNLLASQAKDKRYDLEFIDYSVKDPWDKAWKTECKKRIAQTRGTIVLVGTTTSQSDAVRWEIEETDRQEHPLLGIWVHPRPRPALPLGLSHARMVDWNLDRIVSEIDKW